MGRPYKCPYCGSTATVKKGARKTKTLGARRLRKCKGCGRKFTPKNQPSVDPESAVGIGTDIEPSNDEIPAEEADSQPGP
jgi:transcriptional regulator NrdR family protein